MGYFHYSFGPAMNRPCLIIKPIVIGVRTVDVLVDEAEKVGVVFHELAINTPG